MSDAIASLIDTYGGTAEAGPPRGGEPQAEPTPGKRP
jgi:hypothetical protein